MHAWNFFLIYVLYYRVSTRVLHGPSLGMTLVMTLEHTNLTTLQQTYMGKFTNIQRVFFSGFREHFFGRPSVDIIEAKMLRYQGRNPPDDLTDGETGRTGKTGLKNGFLHSNLAIYLLVILAVVIVIGTLTLGLLLGLRDDEQGRPYHVVRS